jgi:hypothetical protein
MIARPTNARMTNAPLTFRSSRNRRDINRRLCVQRLAQMRAYAVRVHCGIDLACGVEWLWKSLGASRVTTVILWRARNAIGRARLWVIVGEV